MQYWQILGDLHPRLVQFPLVLLLTGLVFDLAGLIARSPRCHFAAKAISTAGTLFLLVAFICGIYAEIWAGRAGIPQEQIEWHELMANIASWGFVVLMAWRMFLNENTRKSLAVYTMIGLAWYVLLVITGYFGGKLVFEYGAAVVGGRANDVLTLHDLNVLATRQTDENLKYSELMHHVAGWVTIALSGSLFVYALFPSKASKLKWVGPAIFLLGGIGLFFFADLDLYKLTDIRQLRDREVQLHKTLSLILISVGVIGLTRIRKGQQEVKSRLATPSKVVAVMALIGGGMLFTHVHTVAPYANVAAGVYIAHIVMGLTALGIGAARLAQDAFPRFSRLYALLFAMLMCVESILLITYNEGLPWYIGYGHYQRWGMNADGSIDPKSPVAPYGPFRAQLNFNQKTQQIDLFVKDRFTEASVAIPAEQVNLVVSRGYSEIGIPLTADSTRTHYSASAPFLKDVMAFSARAALPVNGAMKMGYFDPWVTAAITPVPPNKVAHYQCPMHEGIISENPGVCPLCGMTLMPIQRTPPKTLHKPEYDMRLDVSPAGAAANQPVVLTFTPLHDGSVLHTLQTVHEKLLHLIIISADFTYFDHVHPVMQPDGSLKLPYTFPRSGTYLLYADITPAGERAQVFRLPVFVKSNDPSPELLMNAPDLTPPATFAKAMDDDPSTTAELFFQPRTPVAGVETHFLIRLSKDGLPVNNLEPYLGAMSHCVIISQDSQVYLHCHPEQAISPTPDARAGPDVPFATTFPRPGRYKMWAQFRRNDKLNVVSFAFEVKPSLLPPNVIRFLLDD
jgi:uncharacterized membrane protein